MKIEINFRG